MDVSVRLKGWRMKRDHGLYNNGHSYSGQLIFVDVFCTPVDHP